MRVQVITVTIAAAAIFAAPAAASAGTTAASALNAAASAAVQKKAPATTKVCRLLEPPTGSLIKERVCLTEEQWKKVDKQLGE